MLAARNGNHLDSGTLGYSWPVWVTGLAIASSLFLPAASQAQMQALPPPPNSFPASDANTAPYPPMMQPVPGYPGAPAPASVYPYPSQPQGSMNYGGSYQVIVYGSSPYLLRQIKFLEPTASIQNYQGRQVIVAGSFDSPAAAQARVMKLSDYGVSAQAVSGMAVSSPAMSPAPLSMPNTSPMLNPMAVPPAPGMNNSLSVPTPDTPPNFFPNATPNAIGTAPMAISPTGMPTSSLPPASVTPPTAIPVMPSSPGMAPVNVAPTGVPMNSWASAPTNPPMAIAQVGAPMSPPPGFPMDGATVTPPTGVPVNAYPPNMPMNAPMGSPPMGTGTITPPSGPIPGNSNSTARYEVVIPTRPENFSSVANRLMGMGVNPAAIQGRQQPRGPHVSVGPYLQYREAEAMTRTLQTAGMNARVFFIR